ncbi:MAG: ABC transporter ATP-binding protein/permease [marine benthic group bacterium]|jgi:ATP-binding cassette subfamily B protein|nr:ABC transporter ATP-binding protein/permease [Candidatus Benthicola marisminoris]
MRRLLAYLRPYWLHVVVAVGILIAASGLALVGPWLTKIAIDQAFPAGDMRLLGTLAVVYVGSMLVAGILEYGRTLLTTWIGQRVMEDLRAQIFRHVQRLELAFFDRNPVGRLMTRVTSDVEALNEMFTSGVVTIFGDVFTIGAIVTAMLILDWRLALVTFTVLPLVFLSAWLFRTRVRRAYRDIRLRLARINSFLQERITGMSVTQLFRQEERTYDRFDEINRDHLSAHLKSITYYALFFPTVEILSAVAMALIIWYGGSESLRGAMTVGTIAAFLQYARRFFRPIQDLSEKYNILQSAMASSERVFRLLDREPHPVEAEPAVAAVPALPTSEPGVAAVPSRGGRIEFRDVWFRYGEMADDAPAEDAEEAEWVLRNITFDIEPGQRVAIVGATGAGKSTLINLLMRFYRPQRGQILLDGTDISAVPAAAVRRRIGLVLQDVYLFSDTVERNIDLGRSDVTDSRVREAARRVGVAPYVERLPEGFEQRLGERGSNLSAGERQLLSFARALAGDPDLLILDEATSAVDSEIEARIERALEELMTGRTSLVIAHRLSTIRNADRILVMHHGEIRETGTHEELLQLGGLYTRLHRLQFAGSPSAA